MAAPLADRLRPRNLDDVVGQSHIVGENGMIRRIMASGNIPNMIFYGPPGTGKTTVAEIMARQAGKKLFRLNGTNASTSDIREVISSLNTIDGMNGVVLYLDEIQYLNKKQQQTLLEFLENGSITLIASTTENPYFYVYNAILSRSTVFEFRSVAPADIEKAVLRAVKILGEEYDCSVDMEDGVASSVAYACGGDVRKSLNMVEVLFLGAKRDGDKLSITLEDVEAVSEKGSLRYGKGDDMHFDLLSALQKSVRGSDENAALHYLARLLEAGDLISPCRRLLVMASEDIGLAYPQCISIVKACVDSALQLGIPEARIPLAQAVIVMCTAPKSNSAICAIDEAMTDIRRGGDLSVPDYLRDGHYDGAKKMGHAIGYHYPHDYPNHYYPQTYLPASLAGKVYYHFGDNKTEQAAAAYRAKILADVKK